MEEQAQFTGCEGFLPEFSQTYQKKLHKNVTSKKKALHVILGAVGPHSCSYFQEFAQIFKDFVKIFRDFAQISTDFSGFSTDQNFW